MARDNAREELVNSLASVPGLTQKAMFREWAWLANGNLVRGAS
jgi:hypothetical protein